MAHGGQEFTFGEVSRLGRCQRILQILGAVNDASFQRLSLRSQLRVQFGLLNGDRQMLGNLLQKCKFRGVPITRCVALVGNE